MTKNFFFRVWSGNDVSFQISFSSDMKLVLLYILSFLYIFLCLAHLSCWLFPPHKADSLLCLGCLYVPYFCLALSLGDYSPPPTPTHTVRLISLPRLCRYVPYVCLAPSLVYYFLTYCRANFSTSSLSFIDMSHMSVLLLLQSTISSHTVSLILLRLICWYVPHVLLPLLPTISPRSKASFSTSSLSFINMSHISYAFSPCFWWAIM